jgi:hypothetical protein
MKLDWSLDLNNPSNIEPSTLIAQTSQARMSADLRGCNFTYHGVQIYDLKRGWRKGTKINAECRLRNAGNLYLLSVIVLDVSPLKGGDDFHKNSHIDSIYVLKICRRRYDIQTYRRINQP